MAPNLGPAAVGTCADAVAVVSMVTPTVWLVVDGSTSMETEFAPGATRWDALRTTLMGPTGIVATLQSAVHFGLVIYAGGDAASQCVQLITVDPALNNYDAINAVYPMTPVDQGTPTDKALDYVFMNLASLNRPLPDVVANPVFVVLATDGAPNDRCAGGSNRRGQGSNANVEQRVVDIAALATQNGANMFVISLAGGDARLQAHLANVASVTASKQPPFVPASQGDLITALRSVVTQGTCQVVLNGTVSTGLECNGAVLLNGQPLVCNSDNGWRLTGPSTLALTGTACDTFLSTQSQVQASFPCEVFVPD